MLSLKKTPQRVRAGFFHPMSWLWKGPVSSWLEVKTSVETYTLHKGVLKSLTSVDLRPSKKGLKRGNSKLAVIPAFWRRKICCITKAGLNRRPLTFDTFPHPHLSLWLVHIHIFVVAFILWFELFLIVISALLWLLLGPHVLNVQHLCCWMSPIWWVYMWVKNKIR